MTEKKILLSGLPSVKLVELAIAFLGHLEQTPVYGHKYGDGKGTGKKVRAPLA